MNNACPGCGAVYAVAEKDIGRRIACKKCSAALIVADDGLRYDEEAAAPPARREDEPERERGRDRDRDEDRERDDEDRGSRRRRDRDREETDEEREARRARRAAATADIMNKIKGIGDVATWLYAIGLILTIYAKYAGDIDGARIAGRQGVKIEEEHDLKVAKREIDAKKEEDKRTEYKDDEKKEIERLDKKWKERGNELDDNVVYAQTRQQRGIWWNTVYKLLGFILLGFGAIGYLKPEQGPYKRILGGVTIALILAQVVGGFPLFR